MKGACPRRAFFFPHKFFLPPSLEKKSQTHTHTERLFTEFSLCCCPFHRVCVFFFLLSTCLVRRSIRPVFFESIYVFGATKNTTHNQFGNVPATQEVAHLFSSAFSSRKKGKPIRLHFPVAFLFLLGSGGGAGSSDKSRWMEQFNVLLSSSRIRQN